MSLFLTPEDLRELTGYRRQAAQIRWLREHGYLFDVRADGKPVVLWSHVNQRLGGSDSADSNEPEPNWSALDDAAA